MVFTLFHAVTVLQDFTFNLFYIWVTFEWSVTCLNGALGPYWIKGPPTDSELISSFFFPNAMTLTQYDLDSVWLYLWDVGVYRLGIGNIFIACFPSFFNNKLSQRRLALSCVCPLTSSLSCQQITWVGWKFSRQDSSHPVAKATVLWLPMF